MNQRPSISHLFESPDSLSTGLHPAPPPIDDYFKWAFEQAAHIRAGRFDCVDILNVADEIEDVGKSEFREFASNLEIVLLHMLKWEFQPEKRSRSWTMSIIEHRARAVENLTDNPSLSSRWALAAKRAYGHARVRASDETKLPISVFPETCCYERKQIMDIPYEWDVD